MQFRPPTFAAHATDGDGNGTADPHDIDDATATAAVYLCAVSDGQIRDERSVLLAYNSSEAYVLKVLNHAETLTGPDPGQMAARGVCPIAGPVGFTDTRGVPRSGGRTHQGVEIFARHGTPVVAPVDGDVQHFWNDIRGRSFRLWGDDGTHSYGTHLSAHAPATNDYVLAGTLVGYVGTSGNAAGTSPHLHFEIHPGRRPGDPTSPVNPTAAAEVWCAATRQAASSPLPRNYLLCRWAPRC